MRGLKVCIVGLLIGFYIYGQIYVVQKIAEEFNKQAKTIQRQCDTIDLINKIVINRSAKLFRLERQYDKDKKEMWTALNDLNNRDDIILGVLKAMIEEMYNKDIPRGIEL